ncbi:MAG TPA: phosphatidate cytidylyltransferase [Candidatus Acidoferrales bacterium]|nr:phosphatidate cytidylyltransferase [Candidatus Acidoferrales bacterium]
MLARILTAAILIPAVVALVWWGPLALLAAAAAGVAILALIEFFRLGERVGLPAFQKWTIACVAGLFYAQYSTGLIETHNLAGGVSIVRDAAGGTLSIEALLLIFVFGAVGIGIATRRPLHEVLPAIAISSAGLLVVALPFSYLVRISEIDGVVGRQLVLLTLCMMWAGDTFAYFVGRSIGRLPMAPALSPKKTWEGAFANLLGSLLVALLFERWMHVDLVSLLVIAGLANIAGQAGDLIKSAYKRGASVKDSGSLLPGHGGVLDRIDSLILASPVVWIAWQWLASR